MTDRLYGYAIPAGIDLGIARLGGPGLSNMLFCWGRCMIFCKREGAIPIYTSWPQIKPGAWLRWEADKRHYANLFRPLSDEVRGLRKLKLLTSLRRCSEEEWRSGARGAAQLVEFRGNRDFFLDFPREEFAALRARFYEMIRDRSRVARRYRPHIGVHIRRGDMPPYDPTLSSTKVMRLPNAWYKHVIELILAESAWTGEIGICSDADDVELSDILSLPNVRRVANRTALDDLLYLANSILVVGSVSSFSEWAAFLSGRPSIWHPAFYRNGGLAGHSLEVPIPEDGLPDPTIWRNCMEQAFHASGPDFQPAVAERN